MCLFTRLYLSHHNMCNITVFIIPMVVLNTLYILVFSDVVFVTAFNLVLHNYVLYVMFYPLGKVLFVKLVVKTSRPCGFVLLYLLTVSNSWNCFTIIVMEHHKIKSINKLKVQLICCGKKWVLYYTQNWNNFFIKN